MLDGDWLGRLPVISSLAPGEAAVKLREIGENELADALAATPAAMAASYGLLSRLGIHRDRAWLHTAHAIGYLAPAQGPHRGVLSIRHAADILPDVTLKGARVETRDAGRTASR